MINIIITAPKGKMDSLIVKEALQWEDINIVGCIGPEGRDYIGKDVSFVLDLPRESGVKVYSDIEEIIETADVIVDFSTVEFSMEIVDACKKHKKPLICGTTGLTEEETKKLLSLSEVAPVMKAANTSVMVNVLMKMLEVGAKTLAKKTDIDIIDYHDALKKDAPSGTGKELGACIAEAGNIDLEKINFHSIRSGDISSSHTVIFGNIGERIEVTHHAYNWKNCAKGALEAVRFMSKKSKGIYEMSQVVDQL